MNFLLHTGRDPVGPMSTLVSPSCAFAPPSPEARIPYGSGRTPEVVTHPGLRHRSLVNQVEIRDLISAACFAQHPNPGSDRARAKCELFDVSLAADAVGVHFATV
jgi:hypothetical protein